MDPHTPNDLAPGESDPQSIRAERARRILRAAKVRAAKDRRWPRYLLTSQYADAGRGVQCSASVGEDPAELLGAAQRVVWDGWLPTTLHDLDLDTADDVAIRFALPTRAVHPKVSLVEVPGREDGTYVFQDHGDAERFADAVDSDTVVSQEFVIDRHEVDHVIAAETSDDDQAEEAA